MTALLAALRRLWARLNPQALKYGALLLAAALLLSGTDYGCRRYQRHRLATAQQRATAAHAAAQQQAARTYAAYQLDSTRRAAERRQLLENARTQHERNEALTRFRPALIDLPERPPRP